MFKDALNVKVSIKDLHSTITEVSVDPKCTIDNLIDTLIGRKEEPSQFESINKEQVKLFFKGLELKNDQKLTEVGIIDGSMLYMLKRLKKPVILFYNYEHGENISVKIKLDCNLWRFDKVYPLPKKQDSNNLIWEVIYHENNKLINPLTKRQYSSLFWEANITGVTYMENCNVFTLEKFFCCASSDIEDFLDNILDHIGLNTQERFDLISYWLPELKGKTYIKFSFLDQEVYNKIALMEIKPMPKKILRVILIFLPVETYEESTLSISEIPNFDRSQKESTVIEWGGLNLDHI